METCISVLMCIIHCLLIVEINNIIKQINVPPLKIRIKQSLADIRSRRSIYRGVVQNHPDLGVDVVFKDNNILKSEWDTTAKINKILSTSLSEYIRRDLKSVKGKLPIEAGKEEQTSDAKSQSSMEKIYEYLLKEPEVQKRLNPDGLERVERTEVLRLH